MSQSLSTLIALNLEELRLPDDYNYLAQNHDGAIYVSVDKPEFEELEDGKFELPVKFSKKVSSILLPLASNQKDGYLTRRTVEEIIGASFVGDDCEVYFNPSPEAMTYRLCVDWLGGFCWEPVEESQIPKSMHVLEQTL
tara:strand:- start:6738 stop:7154 length:417 start_codon:yes stop_codon:yes gene_type:complete